MKKKCIDHMGNTFNSQSEMCAYWGVSCTTYLSRLKAGRTQAEALSKQSRSAIFDFAGNEYHSAEDMCRAYGLSLDTYNYRIQHGWDKQTALTTPIEVKRVSQTNQCRDPEGRVFPSFSALCRFYGKSRALVKYRMSKGLCLEAALKIKEHMQISGKSTK